MRRFGVNLTPSMISRSGSPTLVAGTDVWPFASLIAPCGPGCVTAAVCAELAEAEPEGFVAVTVTRSVLSTSAAATV